MIARTRDLEYGIQDHVCTRLEVTVIGLSPRIIAALECQNFYDILAKLLNAKTCAGLGR